MLSCVVSYCLGYGTSLSLCCVSCLYPCFLIFKHNILQLTKVPYTIYAFACSPELRTSIIGNGMKLKFQSLSNNVIQNVKIMIYCARNAERTFNPVITYAEKMQLALTCSSFNWVHAPDWRISKASEYFSAATYL